MLYPNSPEIYNSALYPFSVNYSEVEYLTVINGRGVTLDNSIIGISFLNAIKIKSKYKNKNCMT